VSLTGSFDIAVVGAGAAGLLAAIQAKRAAPSKKIVLFDSRKKIGAKILMSGGTRCNVTNAKVTPSDYSGGPSHFIKHVLEAFRPEETIEFFKAIGVELVLETEFGKYFPASHQAKTVLEALTGEVARTGVELVTGVKVIGLVASVGGFKITSSTEAGAVHFTARRVILATGGLSHPDTGSDGTGLCIAQALGHTVTRTTAALTPLLTDDAGWKSLTGLAIPAAVFVFAHGKKIFETKAPMLFTHFGFSGPAALDASRHYAQAAPAGKPEVFASFAPGQTPETLARRFAAFVEGSPARTVSDFLKKEFDLPARVVEAFLKKSGVEDVSVSRFGKKSAQPLWHLFLHVPLAVKGVFGYVKAEATAGGVDLSEVRVATMESKLVPGLYFAGEILDVDGRIGGFNFQWAWSSGAVAGRACAHSVSLNVTPGRGESRDPSRPSAAQDDGKARRTQGGTRARRVGRNDGRAGRVRGDEGAGRPEDDF